ncbi:MAG TPA: hypothetical protein VF257_15850 [Solirubrobacteraceae bacterium]
MRAPPASATLDGLLPPWTDVPPALVDAGLWCVIEVCTDVPAQRWEPRLVLFLTDAVALVREVAAWIEDVPMWDARVAGYARDALRRDEAAPTALCHVAL